MSFVSNGSLNENTTPYIGSSSRSGLRPYVASSSAARSSASGRWRKNSHTGGAPGGSGPSDGMPVEVAAAGHRALAADVERRERVQLPGVRDADDHAELLLDRRIGCGRLHAAEFERRSRVLVEVGKIVEASTVSRGKRERRARAHRSVASGTGAPSSVTSRLATPLYARTRAR